MSSSRISLSIAQGDFPVPTGASVLLLRPRAETDLSGLGDYALEFYQGFKPDHDVLKAKGLAPVIEPTGSYDGAAVFLTRSKAEAKHLIALARSLTDGPILVDGLKTDGVESIYKEARKKAVATGAISKAHGKCFVINGGDFSDWLASEQRIDDAFVTRAGVFSADAIDQGSQALAAALPAKLSGKVADLGAGWGYLSAEILKRDNVKSVDLIEAEFNALECAKLNITDPRAEFHWEDVQNFEPSVSYDVVVTNPPFHTSRKADPAIGTSFIETAARILAKNGSMWLVANRHLPYEAEIQKHFAVMHEVAGDNRFKILHAEKPRRRAR